MLRPAVCIGLCFCPIDPAAAMGRLDAPELALLAAEVQAHLERVLAAV